jgi:uncharacterized membrane protein YvbJ
MVYCQKCGTKNDEDAEFCKKCANSLKMTGKISKKEHDDKCEEECAIGKQSSTAKYFWGAIIIILGLWVIFEFGLRNIENPPEWLAWVNEFSFWWVFAFIVALIFIVTGIRIMTQK